MLRGLNSQNAIVPIELNPDDNKAEMISIKNKGSNHLRNKLTLIQKKQNKKDKKNK